MIMKSSLFHQQTSFLWKRFFHYTRPTLTAGQTQYHGQKGSTWWEKYGSHVNPVQTRADLLNMDGLDERHFRPVKPVIPTYQSFSCFHDPMVSRVIGILLSDGDRELVENLMDKTFRTIKLIQIGKWHKAKTDEERASIECNPVVLLKKAIKNATPIVRKFENCFPIEKMNSFGQVWHVLLRAEHCTLCRFRCELNGLNSLRFDYWSTVRMTHGRMINDFGHCSLKKSSMQHKIRAER